MNDVDSGLVRVQAVESAFDRLDGALHISLDDEIERLDFAGGDARVNILKCGTSGALPLGLANALLGKLPGGLFVFGNFQNVAGFWHTGDSEDFDRLGGSSDFNRLSAVGEHCPDPPAQAADDNIVAHT